MNNSSEMQNCGICFETLPADGNYLSCQHCNGNYHYAPCGPLAETTYARMTKERRAEWRCTVCRSRIRTASTGSNERPAQKQNRENDEQAENAGKNKRFRSDDALDATQTNSTDLTNDIKDIKQILNDMNNRISVENRDIKRDMSTNFANINDMISRLMSQVADLTEQNKQKDHKIALLECKINEMEQRTLENNLEISNIPAQDSENIINVVKRFANTLDIQLNDNDIVDVFRMRKNKNIVLKLSNRCKKKEFMHKAKKNKTTNTTDKVYVNDQLTAHNKKLLWLTKSAAKQHTWKFVWVRGGSILLKKSENSETFVIKQESDLNIII